MRKTAIQFLTFFCTALTIVNCANRGNPEGGAIDEDPPVITKSAPENYSTNFKANEIRIHFNEYIKIKNLQKQLIISPPMKHQPEITPMGGASKYINIKIYDTLQPNTTYAFNFGNSIVDNNEENPFPYYKYVFSTGPYIDSLELKGNIKDALLMEPDTFVSVMLYEADSTYTDSLVYKTEPRYITNTLDSLTTFTLENLKAGQYKLLAIKDENQDNLYQQQSDKIGFIEAFVNVPNDSLFNIKLFKETPDFEFVRPRLLSGEKIAFGFQGDSEGSEIEITSKVPDSFAYRITKDAKTDSLMYWYKPRLQVDSLNFTTKHDKYGYAEEFTARISEQPRDSLTVNIDPKGNIHYTQPLKISSAVPFEALDETKISLLDKDSTAVDFSMALDSLNNTYEMNFDKTEEGTYYIQMLPETFTGFFGKRNDTLSFTLKTKAHSAYGNARFSLENAQYPIIVQLTTEAGEVKYEQYAETPKPVDFFNIEPGDYYLRVVFDENQNGVYDTGNFLKQQQPERVSYDSKIVEIRANWDEIRTFRLLD